MYQIYQYDLWAAVRMRKKRVSQEDDIVLQLHTHVAIRDCQMTKYTARFFTWMEKNPAYEYNMDRLNYTLFGNTT